MENRLPIVGVMGSGTLPGDERAPRLGRWLAEIGVHLLTGGGGGTMASVSRAFHEVRGRSGLVIGIVPCRMGSVEPPEGYPNPWVEIPIFTHLPLSGAQGTDLASRNHINVLSSDAIVALPGGAGTRSEVALALAYGRPLVAYLNSRDEIQGLPDEVPVRSRFEQVCIFVSEVLAARAARADPAPPGEREI